MAELPKLNQAETQILKDALEAYLRIQLRARNNSKQPEFNAIYEKIIKEIQYLAAKL